MQLIIIKGSYRRSVDELAIGLQELRRKGRCRVCGRAEVSAEGHFVVRVGWDVVPEHNPVKPGKFSNVADVCSIAGHDCLGHLAGGHLNVVACTRAHKSFELEAVVP